MNFNDNLTGYLPEQRAYAARVQALLKERVIAAPKAHIVTFGCQQNVSDSERIKGMLILCGYALTEEITEADFILFNTFFNTLFIFLLLFLVHSI